MNDTKTTATLETTTPVTDTPSEQVVAGQENNLERASLDKGKDEYQQRVDRLLAEAEAKKNGEELEPEMPREGESWDTIYSKATPEMQRVMNSMRADYTRKTQEVAQQRKELEQMKSQIQAQQIALQDNEAYKAIKQQAEAEVGEFDPYDPQSFQRYVEKQVAQRLQSILEPMAQQQMKASAQQKVQSFISEHPELQTDESFKAEVRQTLLGNENLTLQDAYFIVKGRQSQSLAQRQAAEQEAFRKAAKTSGLKVGMGQNKGTTVPSNATKMKATDLYQHLLAQKK